MGNGVSRETFDRMTVKSQLGTLFDLHIDTYKAVQALNVKCVGRQEACEAKLNDKICALDKKMSMWKGAFFSVAAVFGLVGGFLHDYLVGKVIKP